MLEIPTVVRAFFQTIAEGKTEVYNEFSLQHELGCFLRQSLLVAGYKVQFERPVRLFGLRRDGFVKSEIDITLVSACGSERYAIELKFPRNGMVPEQMFNFCKDISFLEQLVAAGFTAGFFIAAVDDPLFYSGAKTDGIYSHFRIANVLSGTVHKPTGPKDETVNLCGNYTVSWQDVSPPLKYICLVARHISTPSVGKSATPQKLSPLAFRPIAPPQPAIGQDGPDDRA